MHSAIVYSIGPSTTKPDGPLSETGGSKNSKDSDETCKMMMSDPDDWRTTPVHYLENPGHIADRKV
jgi:hypothetical protein